MKLTIRVQPCVDSRFTHEIVFMDMVEQIRRTIPVSAGETWFLTTA
jgi:hypothetical protein